MDPTELAGLVLGACLIAALAAMAAYVSRLVRRVRENEGRVERLERQSMTDDLTGLPNRRLWEEQLPRELGRALRYDEPVCVAMIDLDRFKDYNDGHGHQAGDRLLKEVAGVCWDAVRPYDLVARYGSEQFSLTLTGCALEEGVTIVERLRRAAPSEISCSAGIAEWDREEYPEALVGRADGALYQAKLAGRDRTMFSEPTA